MKNAMSFRFSSWTKVSLILLAAKALLSRFCDRKIPEGWGKIAKREGTLENLLLSSLFPRAPGNSIACNSYRLRY